jgi:CheY-like chemotaxis protein
MADDILVVDDNELNRRLLEFILAAANYPVRSASNAQEAIAAIAAGRPRVILMDIQMPGMSGLDLTRQLKADPATRDIAIIAVTAYAMKGDREKAHDAGCDAYVTKPIDKEELRRIVSSYYGTG